MKVDWMAVGVTIVAVIVALVAYDQIVKPGLLKAGVTK